MSSLRSRVSWLFALAALALPTTAGTTWVVARVPGPGVDFTSVQEAVDAASDGDLVLVRSGKYGGVVVDGKGLTIQEAPGNKAEADGIVARNLTSGQTLVVRGLFVRLTVPIVLPFNVHAVTLTDCQGSIWLEDCEMEVEAPLALGDGGLLADNCSEVVLVRCTIRGEHSGDGDHPSSTSHGVESLQSNLYLFDCDSMGGYGPGGVCEDVFGGCSQVLGGFGGSGLDAELSTVFAYACRFTGGNGVAATCCVPGPSCSCSLHGTGGVGANLVGTSLRHLATAFDGGGGSGYSGIPMTSLESTVEDLGQRGVRSLDVSSPATSGASVSATLTGRAGDLVFVYASNHPEPSYRPELQGTLLLGPPGYQVSMHFLGQNGTKAVTLPAVTVPPMTAVTRFLQPVVLNANDRVLLGSGSALAIRAL